MGKRNFSRGANVSAEKPRASTVPICPTCGHSAKMSEGRFGMKAECCGLWSWGGKALVSRETHAARIQAHEAFDALWKSGQISRTEAYGKLAELMGMTRDECHMSLMTAEQAGRVKQLVITHAILDDPPEALRRTTRTHPSGRRHPSRRDIWITVGEDHPSNTSGERQVHNFPTLEAAHEAGFTWAV